MKLGKNAFETDEPQRCAVYDWIQKNRPDDLVSLCGIVKRLDVPQVAEFFPHLRDRNADDIGGGRLTLAGTSILQLGHVKGPGSFFDEGLLPALQALNDMDALPLRIPSVGIASPWPRTPSPQTDGHHRRRNECLEAFLIGAQKEGRITAETLGKAQAIFAARKKQKRNDKGRSVNNDRPSIEQIDAALHNARELFSGHKLRLVDSFTRILKANHGRGAPMFRAKRHNVVWEGDEGAIPTAVTCKAAVGNKWYPPYFIPVEDRAAFLLHWNEAADKDTDAPLYYNWAHANPGQPAKPLRSSMMAQALSEASFIAVDGKETQLCVPQLCMKHFRPAGHRRMTVEGLSDAEIEALLVRGQNTQMTIRYTEVLSVPEMTTWMARIRNLVQDGQRRFHAKCRGLLDNGHCAACDGPITAPPPVPVSQPADLLVEVYRRRLAGAA